ncbi:MAG: hypothetical protein H0U75_10895 [Legionella sp.]|nr:hypothetical protein [Legionella sp.]
MIANTTLNSQVTLAFNAAIKIDRVSIFNQVVMENILNHQLHSPEFNEYLNKCISLGKDSVNYDTSQSRSSQLVTQSNPFIKVNPKHVKEPIKPSDTELGFMGPSKKEHTKSNEPDKTFKAGL